MRGNYRCIKYLNMKNSYPELPILPYKRTSVPMSEVIAYLQSNTQYQREVKRAVYVFWRFESANGKSGVNNNYIGMQSDGARWPQKLDKYLTGVCIKKENGTGKERGFLCLSRWQDSVDILLDRIKERGLYVGGFVNFISKMAVTSPQSLCIAYEQSWVVGSKNAQPSPEKMSNFLSMYSQAVKLFDK
jgi:hypothetical protein